MKIQCSIWINVIQLYILCSRLLADVVDLPEVIQLSAEPDFRSVTLHWEYPKIMNKNLYGFQIHYCELQAWGPNRCRTKIIDSASGIDIISGKKYFMYSVIISSLRMATNYSFEVKPLESKHNINTKEFGKTITVPTRGFSAKANLCLPDVSEVEVSTGPYFGGRIAVESSNNEKLTECAIGGDANSSRDSYVLRIEHKTCGSSVNRTTVSTFILVQENLPILTHSTRRFLVLCTFQPETLTVRAGINLPHTESGEYGHLPANEVNLMNEISNNVVQAASLLQSNEVYQGRSFDDKNSESHFLLLIILGLSGVIGIAATIWWFVPLKKLVSLQTRSTNSSILSNDSFAISAYENYSNSIRDTASITDIDFNNMIDDDSIPNDIVCKDGGVFNETMKNLITSPQSKKQQTVQTVPLDGGQLQQSEA